MGESGMGKNKVEKNKKKARLPRHKSLGWLVAVLGMEMAAALAQRLKAIGLNLVVWPTLYVLWEEDGLTQTELASRCRTAHYTTTRVLDALEQSGLIERRPHPESRRTHLVYLTPAGHALEQAGVAEATACNREFLARLSEEEGAQLVKLLRKAAREVAKTSKA